MKTSRLFSWLRVEWRWLVVSILVAHGFMGTLYSLATPIWEGPDEWGHYSHVKYLIDNHSLPGPEDSTSPLDQLTHPPLYYILTALATSWVDARDGLQPVENPYAYSGIMEGGVNRFIHTDAEAFPYRGTVLAVHVARLFSVFISTLVVLVTYRLGRLLFPAQQQIALGAMAITAFSPGFLFMASVINNDILVTLFFALSLYFSVKVVMGDFRLRDLFALGSFTGLAILSKYNALALVPLVIVAVGVAVARAVRRQRSLRTPLMGAFLLVVGLALVYGWWLFRSATLFGGLTTRSRSIVTRFLKDLADPLHAAGTVQWDVLPEALRYFYKSFWASFGWGNIEAEMWVYQLLGLLCLVGIAGFLLFLVRRASPSVKLGSLMLLLGFVFVSVLALYRTLAFGDPVLRGRYALPSMSGVSVLLSLGIVRLTPTKLGRVPILLAALSVLVLGLIAPFRYIVPAYARPPIQSSEETMVIQNPLVVNFGNKMELIGYDLAVHKVRPGEFVPITLYWRCLAKMDEDYTVGLSLLGHDGKAYGKVAAYPGRGNYATSQWKPGDIVEDSYQVRLGRRFPTPGMARIHLAVYTHLDEQHLDSLDAQGRPMGDAAIFGRVGVGYAENPEYLIENSTQLNLGDQMALLGYDVRQATFTVGCPRLVLYWQALADMEEDYTVFVHVLDQQGQILTQEDSQPRKGTYPTSFWEVGEIIEDEHPLCLPRNLRAGRFDVVTGAYLLRTMQRLPMYDEGGQRVPGDSIALTKLELRVPSHRFFTPLVLSR
jgi:4-amino-4-deoxy-L-arabinose transferase-like glycosyltransferase